MPCARTSRSRGCRSGASAARGRRCSGCGRTTSGSAAGRSVEQPLRVELAVRRRVPLHGGELVEARRPSCRCPTAQPQRVAVAVRRRDARRRASPARPPPSAKRCERLANLRSLRSALSSRGVEILDLGGDARRKAAARRKCVIGAAPLRAFEQRRPRRGDVVADRRDQARGR